MNRNFDLFDWKGIAEDLMDSIDELAKSLPADNADSAKK
jgi:hypothetical protein